jgi:RNA polymerase sigma-70 factor (ECF subfamily)
MKEQRGSGDEGEVQLVATPLMVPAMAESTTSAITAREVYEQHADFVWRTLQHLGARSADLEDLGQEVFITVHRKLSSFDGRSKLTTWLFGICLNLVRRQRRRAYIRLEFLHAEPPERVDPSTPEARYEEEEARRRLAALLEKLSPERRATFVLFEVEGATCEEIAELTSVPLGTVYSRLHSARKQVAAAVARMRRAEQRSDAP